PWPHRLSLSAHALDVRGYGALPRGAQRLPHPRPEGAPGRAVRSCGPSALSRLKSFRLLYRPHSLCRRRLHGGLTGWPSDARIAVIGAGLMGHGIAQVFALAGHEVHIHDGVMASLDSAKSRILANLKDLGDDPSAVERVHPVADIAGAVGDAQFVVEAVSEDLPLKQKIFAEIERYAPAGAIMA